MRRPPGALIAQALGPPQRDPFRCFVIGGDWYSPFDGVHHSGSASELDVDHVVAHAEAWDSGAWAWTTEQRRQFANDPINLVVVTASANRAKADLDAGQWPPHGTPG
jgi:hypothetical protein